MEELHVFTDKVDTYIATSAEDALALQREQHGVRQSDQDPEAWERLPEDQELAIVPDPYAERPVSVKKTCAQWIAEKGRGFLCSTEY